MRKVDIQPDQRTRLGVTEPDVKGNPDAVIDEVLARLDAILS